MGLLFLAIGAHPFATYPLSLVAFARRLKVDPDEGAARARPSVAICMSAYNEEAVIETKVESLIAMAQAYGPATVHVFADAPTDRTAELLQRYADRIDLVISTERSGKTCGMNVLVGRSSSELLLFTDANVTHDAAILENLVAPFADRDVGCVSAQLVYSNRRESPTSATGAFYWTIEERIKQIESRTVGMVGVDGAMFMVRRSLHRPPPASLIDDLYLSLVVLISGARLVTVEAAQVFERSAVHAGEEFERKKRIACQAMNVHFALWPELRKMPFLRLYAYISHRLIKWLTPFLLLMSLLCFFLALVLAVGWPAAAVTALGLLALLWIGDRMRLKPFALMATATLSLAGVGLGVLQSLFTTQSYTFWDPAGSVRDESVSKANL